MVYSNARSVRQDILDFLRNLLGALQRSRIGKLQVDVHVALIFVGQEAGGHPAAEEAGREPKTTSNTSATALLRMSAPDQCT